MQFALPLSLLLPFCDLYYGGSTVLSIVNSFVHMFALRELVEINIHLILKLKTSDRTRITWATARQALTRRRAGLNPNSQLHI